MQAIADGQASYRVVSMQPLSTATSVDEIASTLANASTSLLPPDISEADVGMLIQHTAEFIHFRFGQASVTEYSDWRRRRGYIFSSRERLKALGVVDDYKLFMDRPYLGDSDFLQAFQDLWPLDLGPRKGAWCVSGMANDRAGLALNFGRLTPTEPGAWPRVSGVWSEERWHGLSAGGHRSWWTAPRGSASVYFRVSKRLDVASVAFVAKFCKGDAYPLRLLFFRDPETRSWWIEACHTFNFEYNRLPIIEL